MKYFIFFIALIITTSVTGFAQIDSTQIDSTATPVVFTPPTKAELDSIRTMMNEKDLTATATIEDVFNMYTLLKADLADQKVWTKKKFVELPTVNKKGWAAKFTTHFEMTDSVNQENIKNLVTVTSDQENRLNKTNTYVNEQTGLISNLTGRMNGYDADVKDVKGKLNTTIMAVAGENADRDDDAEAAMAQLVQWAKEQNTSVGCDKHK